MDLTSRRSKRAMRSGDAMTGRFLGSVAAVVLIVLSTPLSARADSDDPICDGNWHYVSVPGAVCLDGTGTGYQYACSPGLGPTGPLMVYFENGGACWDADMCNCGYSVSSCLQNFQCCTTSSFIGTNHWGIENSCDGQPYGACFNVPDVGTYASTMDIGQEQGFNSPTSGFNTTGATGAAGLNRWNMALIPYCTGDGLVGSGKTARFTSSTGVTYTATFNGYNDVTLDLFSMASKFRPSKVALWGSSAGSVGVLCNLQQIAAVWPQTQYVMQDALVPWDSHIVPLQPLTFQIWGAWTPGHDGEIAGVTCPIPEHSVGPWGTDLVARSNRQRLPEIRKALTDDYSSFVENFFFCLWNAKPDSQGSCASAVASDMNDVFFEDVGPGNPTYRVFYHDGECHAEREADDSLGLQCATGANVSASCNCPAGATSCQDAVTCGPTTPTCEFDPFKCDYDSMVQNGVHFNDWVRQWLQVPGFQDWDDVR